MDHTPATVFTNPSSPESAMLIMSLKHKGLPYEEHVVPDMETLKAWMKARGVDPGRYPTFPQVFVGDRWLTGLGAFNLHKLLESLDEPLLQTNPLRFTPFPIQYTDMYEMYKKGVASFWTAEEIDFGKDRPDWECMREEERHFIKHVLAFFASSDGIVNENLMMNFANEIQVPEARMFYSYQVFNEAIHSQVYGLLIDTYIREPAEKLGLFQAIQTVPCVRKKAAWALKWMAPERPFAERLIAFVCVEGLLFSGSFCSIFWLRQRGLMPSLCLSNEWISRDEGLHQMFGTMLYNDHVKNKLPESRIREIVCEAVEHELEFIVEAIPCRLIGMNSELMCQYIKFVADSILMSLGCSRVYEVQNPFDWMVMICLSGKSSFFEKRPSEYQKACVLAKPEDNAFGLDADF